MRVWCRRRRGELWIGVLAVVCLMTLAEGFSATAQPQPHTQSQPTLLEKVAASGELLDINTATAAQLKALPGMGNAYAARIIAGRPYSAKNALTKRGILPEAAYQQIKPLIIAHRIKP